MPIFEYKCSNCNKISEFLEKNTENSKRQCPQCGSGNLAKQFSVFSAQVKEGQSKKCLSCTDAGCPHSRG